MTSAIVVPNPELVDYPPGFNPQVVDALTVASSEITALQALNGTTDWKESVRVATTTALAANTRTGNVLEADSNGALGTIDGITLIVGNRLLVKDEGGASPTTSLKNGLYTVTSLGGAGKWSLTRSTDADTSAEVTSGLAVEVEVGTANAAKVFTLVTANPITLNSTALGFDLFSGLVPAVRTITATAPLLIAGTTSADLSANRTISIAAATTIAAGSITLAGDLAGSGATPSVAKVNGTSVPATPTAGSVLQATSTTVGAWTVLYAVLPVLAVAVANQTTLSGVAQTIDGVALDTAGMRVYLAAQTTPAQNGIWVVASGAWTRPADWATGNTPPLGTVIRVAPGGTTNFQSSGGEWMVTATAVIDTGTVTAYPRVYKQTVTLSAGTYKIGFGSTANPDEALFLLSTTTSSVQVTQNTAGTAGGAPTLTTEYACPVATRVAGIPGTAVLVINAEVAAGTLNNADASTLDVLVTNW